MSAGGGFANDFAGGGFMSQQQQEQGGGSGGKGRQSKDQTLRAVTVRQLATAVAGGGGAERDVIVDGAEISNVTLVGKVLTITERSGNNLDLQVADGTGVIECSIYMDTDCDPQGLAQKKSEWHAGRYVRVYGHFQPTSNSWRINAFAIRVVHDFNEVTYHLLQAIFQHLHLSKGGGTGVGAPPAQQFGGAGGYGGPAAGGWQQQQQPMQQQAGGYGGGAPAVGGMEGCPAAVLQIISDPSAGDQGVHVNDVCSRLAQQGFNRQQVESALTFLQNEAHAYTTSDDHHWKATA